MLLIFTIGALCMGIIAGAALGFGAGQRDRLPSHDRKELGALRDLQSTLTRQAAQHAAMGDNFAAVVLDEIDTTRRKIG